MRVETIYRVAIQIQLFLSSSLLTLQLTIIKQEDIIAKSFQPEQQNRASSSNDADDDDGIQRRKEISNRKKDQKENKAKLTLLFPTARLTRSASHAFHTLPCISTFFNPTPRKLLSIRIMPLNVVSPPWLHTLSLRTSRNSPGASSKAATFSLSLNLDIPSANKIPIYIHIRH